MLYKIYTTCTVIIALNLISGPAWADAREFKPGNYKAEIISATDDCELITIERLKASNTEINGRWEHTETRGKLKISLQNNAIQIDWQGTLLISDKEEIQIDGKSLLIDVHLRHHFGNCTISFKVPGVLN